MSARRRNRAQPPKTRQRGAAKSEKEQQADFKRRANGVRQVLSVGLVLYSVYLYFTGRFDNSKSLRSLWSSNVSPPSSRDNVRAVDTKTADEVWGHADFDDGRKRSVKPEFAKPTSDGLYWTNVMLGNGGYVRSGSSLSILEELKGQS